MSKLITKQVLSFDGGNLSINYQPSYGTALNMTGAVWIDCKYKLLKSIIAIDRHSIIVTDTDLIAHDDYIETLSKSQTIVFVLTSSFSLKNTCPTAVSFLGQETLGASKKRLKKAQAKLDALGFKTKYFASERTAVNYVERQLTKQPKAA